MKKFLLSAAIIAAAFSAKAEYTDFFKVTAHGAEVTSGAYIVCTEFEDFTDLDGDNLGYDYGIDLIIDNQTSSSQTVTGKLVWGLYPTKEEYNLHKNDPVEGEGDNVFYSYWGLPQICNLTGNCYAPTDDNNLGEGNETIPTDGDHKGFAIHLRDCPPTKTFDYKVILTPQSDPAQVFECNIVFAPTQQAAEEYLANAGVSDIVTDSNADAPVRYYNLQGQEIANPAHGLYIKCQGNKAEKILLP